MKTKAPRSKLTLRKTTLKNLTVLTEDIRVRTGIRTGATGRPKRHPEELPGACQ